MDWSLELVVVPVTDIDRAKEFYVERLGWTLLVDHRAGEDFRVVQVVPPGSACAIALMRNADAAGSLQGLHLVVSDLDAAVADLTTRGVPMGEVTHIEDGAPVPGPDPARADYGTFLDLRDPDGNGWLVQEVRSRA